MKGEILNLSGSPIDGLVRLEDRGIDNRGRRLLWLHTARSQKKQSPSTAVWNPMPQDSVHFPPKPNGPDGSRWPIWAIPLHWLDRDVIRRSGWYLDATPARMSALLESGGLAATAEDPVSLILRAGRMPDDASEDAGELYPSEGLATGTPDSFGWLVEYFLAQLIRGNLSRPPVVRFDTSLAYARGWLQNENGKLWTA
jgi:hypothetical protein